MSQQSLYRRYRPKRFSEMRGQEHIVRALQNAVEGDTTGQAYLFSGPRGTGKTTTARILAKVLNCTNLKGGEPCGECESCVAMDAGTSYDLFELDAASNNGVDAMRELISRAAVGSPGRTKVYILDEVHMLSTAASNALLKTLEEPPDHVTFVLATTDPQKVLPTIRSRTQHFDFSLLSAEQLEEYVRWIVADAGLDVDDEAIAHVVRAGRGSARDTLSALDQVVAAGGVVDRIESIDELLASITERDTARAIVAMAEAIDQGRDPRVVGESLLAALRDAFLAAVGAPAGHLSDADRDRAGDLGRHIGPAGLTRALELLGAALIEMRQAADPRIPLEVALVRITDVSTDVTLAGLAERVAHLERDLVRGAVAPAAAASRAPAPSSAPAPAPADRAPAASIPPPPPRRKAAEAPAKAAEARPPTAAPAPPPRAEPARTEPPARSEPAAPSAAAGAAPGAELPSVSDLTAALHEGVLAQLKGVTKALYTAGRFVDVNDGVATFALANAPTKERAAKSRGDVEAALAAKFGRPIPLRLVEESEVGGGGSAPPAGRGNDSPPAAPVAEDPADEHVDLNDLTDASNAAASGADKLAQAFPGAVVVEEEP